MADESGNGVGLGAAIGALKELLRAREKSLHRLGQQFAEARDQLKVLTAERDAALKDRAEAIAAAEKAAKDFDAAPLKAEADRLRTMLRERDHRAVFDRLAGDLGVPADARDPLYKLSGYVPEGDAPDQATLTAVLEGLRDAAGTARLFGEAAPPEPPAGSGQGRRDRSGGKFRVTTDQLRDGAWCMANADRLRAARKDGTFELVES